MDEAIRAGVVEIAGHGGDPIRAYFAEPLESGSRPGMVVIHHMPGLDRQTKETVRRFAAQGYFAISPNLYWREAPGAEPDDAAAAARARGGVPDDRLVGDVGGAADFLRARPLASGKVGVIGYCSGGRQAVLAACHLPMQAAVDCYGAFVVGQPPEGFPIPISNLTAQLPNLGCPLLGLFGEDDQHPSPAETAELDALLTGHGKEHDFTTYPGAGHAFFAVDRPSYRPEAAVDGWGRIFAFLGRTLEG